MKIIIGVYDRILSHHLAVALSGKKIFPIEAESFEEIPMLLERHPGALLISEETSVSFYHDLKQKNHDLTIFLLFHPSLSTSDLLKLQNFGIKTVMPYTESADEITETVIRAIVQKNNEDDQSLIYAEDIEHKDAAMHITKLKKWVYGELQGFNSSKVAVKIDNLQTRSMLLEDRTSENLLMYLQGMNIRMYADLLYQKQDVFVFRYRKMSQTDANRLAYYIYYCQQKKQQGRVYI